MEQNKHVYCTECIYGEELIKSIITNNVSCPKICSNCYPYDPENSYEFKIRKNYKQYKRE